MQMFRLEHQYSVSMQALILSAAQPSELKAWRLHSHRQRVTWSLRTLAAFAQAAATEDRRGVLHSPAQPDCPDLATIIATLLSTKLVLQVQRFHAPVLQSQQICFVDICACNADCICLFTG